MKHLAKKHKKLNMNSSHRMAVIKNLAISIIKYGKIETTLAKAKTIRPFIEKIITKAKDLSVTNQRLIAAKLGTNVYNGMLKEIGQKFIDRAGGYTRIIKKCHRYGDCADVAVIELVS